MIGTFSVLVNDRNLEEKQNTYYKTLKQDTLGKEHKAVLKLSTKSTSVGPSFVVLIIALTERGANNTTAM